MTRMDNISNGSAKSEYHSPMDCPNKELKWDDGGCYPRKDVKYCEYCSADLWIDSEDSKKGVIIMNTFNIVTGPVRSGKSTFVKRHAKDSDIIIDEYSGLCMSFDKDKSSIYWLVLDPIRTNEDYYTSLCDQLSKYGQVNHIKIGSIEKFM